MSRIRMSRKRKRICLIATLKNTPKIDFQVSVFLKGILLGGIYGLFNYTRLLLKKSGFNWSYNSKLIYDSFEEQDNKKGLGYYSTMWAISVVLNFASLDNAYENILRRGLKNYNSKCKKNRYDPFPTRRKKEKYRRGI